MLAKELKLKMELVPQPNWGKDLAKLVKKSVWKKISEEVRSKAGWKCEICGAEPSRQFLHAHEIWEYDEENAVQRLVGMISLCIRCHDIKHMGRSQKIYPQERINELIQHFMDVNQCDMDDYHAHSLLVSREWKRRSEIKNWTVDFGQYNSLIQDQPAELEG